MFRAEYLLEINFGGQWSKVFHKFWILNYKKSEKAEVAGWNIQQLIVDKGQFPEKIRSHLFFSHRVMNMDEKASKQRTVFHFFSNRICQLSTQIWVKKKIASPF